MTAPKLEIPKFDGDPLKYFIFMQTFRESVESTVKDNGSRLAQLIQYCEGPALKALQPCTIMPPSKGYVCAKSILKWRFGDEFVIAQAWINRITISGTSKGYLW